MEKSEGRSLDAAIPSIEHSELVDSHAEDWVLAEVVEHWCLNPEEKQMKPGRENLDKVPT